MLQFTSISILGLSPSVTNPTFFFFSFFLFSNVMTLSLSSSFMWILTVLSLRGVNSLVLTDVVWLLSRVVTSRAGPKTGGEDGMQDFPKFPTLFYFWCRWGFGCLPPARLLVLQSPWCSEAYSFLPRKAALSRALIWSSS